MQEGIINRGGRVLIRSTPKRNRHKPKNEKKKTTPNTKKKKKKKKKRMFGRRIGRNINGSGRCPGAIEGTEGNAKKDFTARWEAQKGNKGSSEPSKGSLLSGDTLEEGRGRKCKESVDELPGKVGFVLQKGERRSTSGARELLVTCWSGGKVESCGRPLHLRDQ